MNATAPPSTSSLPARKLVLKQAQTENFPVATAALGPRLRSHLLAIYGFARLVDDTGDEVPGDRTALLDEIEHQLGLIYAGEEPEHPLMRALGHTIRACRLPERPFHRLLEANRRDQLICRYESFEQLLSYCQLSAAPVGELVLGVFRAASAQRVAKSDRVCAALQVIEHIQDVAEDYERGRIYLPRRDLARVGCAEAELGAASASPALREVIALLVRRSHALLEAGVPLAASLGPRPRLAVAGFVAGGRATLEAIERAEFDVLGRRPRRTARGFAAALVRVVSGR